MPYVEKLQRFPVKGCAAEELTHATITPAGISGDRILTLVDPKTREFVSQRHQLPELALVRQYTEGATLHLSALGMQDIAIDLSYRGKASAATVWGDHIDTTQQHPAANRWFRTFLGRVVHLVQTQPAAPQTRQIQSAYLGDNSLTNELTFTDSGNILLVSQASLDDLELEPAVPLSRFRANIETTGEAWAEDEWDAVLVGSVLGQVAWACSRCTVPAIDQETGLVDEGNHILKALGKKRRGAEAATGDKGLFFGQFLRLSVGGTIHKGDEIKVISRAESNIIFDQGPTDG